MASRVLEASSRYTALKHDLIPFKHWRNREALLSRRTKVGIQRQKQQTKGQDLKPGFKVKAAAAEKLIDAEPAGYAYRSLCTASFWNPSCSLDQEALQGLLVKPVDSNLLVSAVGKGKSSTSLLKDSFCGQAKTSGVIPDSSKSLMPHIQSANPVNSTLKM